MKPDLEVVQIGRAESFKAWEHGYPFAILLMIAAAVLPFLYFKWRKWL